MLDVLPHRGPNDRGLYADERAVLGHTRLSIVDVSHGHQLILDQNGQCGIVSNGEIYNFRQLRETYLQHYDIRTNSDSEVILRLYQEKGPECLTYLDGMFAFALLDKKRNRLVLARDRMGIKPLFYALRGKNIYFASEIKALLLSPEISRQIDLESLDSYLTFGYIPGQRTIFKDIKKLPPASCLVFENGKHTISQQKTT